MLPLRVRGCAAGLLLASLASPTEAPAQPTPVGSEFQVNTYTTDLQWDPAVAVGADGQFVVVWNSEGSSGGDTSAESIQGQRYDSAGNAVGSQFQVNTYTSNTQDSPAVAAAANGDFVVVWESRGSFGDDTSTVSIQAQRYDSAGSALGSQFQVNTYTLGIQEYPAIAADADGEFVVVWDSSTAIGDNSDKSVHGQRFDSAGSAVGSQFQVNTYTTNVQWNAAVAAHPDGDFVVVWESQGSLGTDTSRSIQGRRYDSAGNALGSQFQVNTYTTGAQTVPQVAHADSGFVVAWLSFGSSGGDTDGHSIQGQRYDSAGNALGSQFQVNTYTANLQRNPAVAYADSGFVVVWDSSLVYLTPTDVKAQRYDSAGSAVGGELQVNSYTTNYQFDPSVAANAAGSFVVVWSSNGSTGDDTSDSSIQGQRYATAAHVPSLSPAGLAAAALLLCLAVALALRPRV